jgi:hypothetical protein
MHLLVCYLNKVSHMYKQFLQFPVAFNCFVAKLATFSCAYVLVTAHATTAIITLNGAVTTQVPNPEEF